MPARVEVVRDPDPDAVNRLWDAAVAGEASLDGRDTAGQDWSETMQTVRRHAQAMPGPDPRFGQALRDQLLGTFGVSAPRESKSPAVPVPPMRRMRTSRRRHERAWRGWAELAAVATILLAIFGRFVLPASEPDPEPRQAIAPFVATPEESTAESAFFRGTLGRTGQYAGDGLADAVTPLWEHEAPFAEFPMGQLNPGASAGSGAMVAVDGRLYLSARGDIQALDPATGETIWSQEAIRLEQDSWITPVVGPAVAAGLVVYASRARGSSTMAVAALDATTGEARWSQLVQMDQEAVLGWDVSSPLIADGMVYVAVDDGKTSVLPAYADGRVFTGSGLQSSRLIAFDLETGTEAWRISASRLGAYDAQDGHAIWTSQSQANSLAVADGRIHIVVGVGENKGGYDTRRGDR
ncbi:MAG: PQQ-binding-like beta-propeller repeat protein [Thermomicrobiales bacterium]